MDRAVPNGAATRLATAREGKAADRESAAAPVPGVPGPEAADAHYPRLVAEWRQAQEWAEAHQRLLTDSYASYFLGERGPPTSSEKDMARRARAIARVRLATVLGYLQDRGL